MCTKMWDRNALSIPCLYGLLYTTWPCIVGVDLSELGRVDYDSARDGRRDRLSSYYLERGATVLEIPDALQRAELLAALNQLRSDLVRIIVVS